jgi:polyisoprenoid-binding protein YceI
LRRPGDANHQKGNEMSTSTETIERRVPAGNWNVDPLHSTVRFAVTHGGIATYRSGFAEFAVTLSGGEQPRLEGTVEVASIAIEEPHMKGHLMGPEFFDAERFPQLRFSSTELTIEDDGTVRLAGELEMRGERRQVEASGRFGALAADLGGNPRLGLALATAVDRRDFGISFQAELPGGGEVVAFAVAIEVDLQLVAAEPPAS